MINILLITHGNLAQALKETSSLIMGSKDNIHALCLKETDDPVDFSDIVSDKIDTLYSDSGLIVFTDIFGGTPSNSVVKKLRELSFPDNLVCYTGINLPVLLEGIALSEVSDYDSTIESINNILESSISNVSDKFKQLY